MVWLGARDLKREGAVGSEGQVSENRARVFNCEHLLICVSLFSCLLVCLLVCLFVCLFVRVFCSSSFLKFSFGGPFSGWLQLGKRGETTTELPGRGSPERTALRQEGCATTAHPEPGGAAWLVFVWSYPSFGGLSGAP